MLADGKRDVEETVTTKTERDHMGRVASLGCYLCRHMGCGPTPAQVHHLLPMWSRENISKGKKILFLL